MKVAVSLLIFVVAINAKPYKDLADVTCKGYDACAPTFDDKLNVHIVPHSHDDVGWVKTLDQYYYQQVQSIISSVIPSLQQNPDRRFIQVETAFFDLWWRDQPDNIKQDVVDLITEGRLVITNGAWSMNDEAASHYQSTVDQFTLGLRYVQDNLGKCARPNIGWQIDPFGHSREQASLFTQFGYDGFFFARLDYRDKSKRLDDKTMDMLWTGSANLGSESNIFTTALYNHYSTPPNFCWDIRCGDAPIVTDEESPEYNWEQRVTDFANYIGQMNEHYDQNNLLLTFGDDFRWEAAMTTYNNIDKLIAGFKKFNPKVGDKEINLVYSTPACYTKAVNDYVIANNKELDVKTDDFFPYADSPNQVWSGYFTSRPTSKRYERQSNNLLQVSKQLKAIADESPDSLIKLEKAVGVMQHHDAITGTEKEEVEKDYHRRLTIGVEDAVAKDSAAITKILGVSDDLDLKSCLLANVSICSESDKDEFNVVIYNPLAKTTSHYIQIPVSSGTWTVTGPNGEDVENHLTESVRSWNHITLDSGLKIAEKILIFKAENLPALGYNTYNFKKSNSSVKKPLMKNVRAVGQMGFEDNYVNFDQDTGLLKSITLKGQTLDVKQQLMYYKSGDESGAYIFRPSTNERDAFEFPNKVENTVLINDGNLVREVKQKWNDWAQQIIRIYKDEDFIEFDWAVGPIDVADNIGKEVISRFSTSLKTNGEFYTDANGREMIYRKKDYRPTYDYTNEEPQANNYYPVTARIVIKDDTTEFAILNDRAQGGASLNDGELELMVNRALLHDDHKGVDEFLNETEYNLGLIARGSHFVTLGKIAGDGTKSQATVERQIALRKLLQPWVFYTTNEIPVKSQSFLKQELPENIHLFTLDKWSDDDTYLIRLEHILEKDEDPELSKETTVDLTDLFTSFTITSLKEYTLAANVPLEESSRLTWPQLAKVEDGPLSREYRLKRAADDLKITLAPMQIRTFLATVTRN